MRRGGIHADGSIGAVVKWPAANTGNTAVGWSSTANGTQMRGITSVGVSSGCMPAT